MRRALILSAMAGAAICLWAVRTSAADDENKSSEQNFVRHAADISKTEVKLGKLAQEQTSNEQVKRFGERMVKDHTRLNKELMEIAKKQDINLPEKLDQKHQELMEKLSKMKGAEFDRMYAKDMVAGHQKAIELFENEAKNGKDPALKAFAEKSLPILHEHLKLAEQTVKSVQQER